MPEMAACIAQFRHLRRKNVARIRGFARGSNGLIFEESTYIHLDENEIDSIRKYEGAKDAVIRLTGDRHYITLEQEKVTDQYPHRRTLNFYDALTAALKDKIPAECK